MRKNSNVHSDDQLLGELLDNYHPEPLVHSDVESEQVLLLQPNVINDKIGTKILIHNQECINFGSENFLNLVKNEKITEEAIATIRKYGVGSCGPRGFYGTVDVHLDLEERIAKFMKMEEAVVYSYWFSTVASAIPAYCKRHDVVFCDEMISFAAKKGMDAAKCQIIYFSHNNVHDLESKIIAFNEKTKNKKHPARKFLILEGIYYNTGNICDLPQLVELRSKYRMRLFLDESLSIGVLGKTGRGVTEHFNIDTTEIDMIIGSLEGVAGSVGGFCVGSHFIIEHQRLSGLGYCFSASLPPVLTRAAFCAFDYLDDNSPDICAQLRSKCVKVHKKLADLPNMLLFGDECSPLKYLSFIDFKGEPCLDYEFYDKFVRDCQRNGLALVVIKNTGTDQWQIKIAVNIDFTDEEIDKAAGIMAEVASHCVC